MNILRILGISGFAAAGWVAVQLLAIGCAGKASQNNPDASTGTGTGSGTYTGSGTGTGTYTGNGTGNSTGVDTGTITGTVTGTGVVIDTCKATGTHTSTSTNDGPGYTECGVWFCGIAGPNCGTTCKDLNKDPSNCGACGVKCASNLVCVAGKCGTGTGTATGT